MNFQISMELWNLTDGATELSHDSEANAHSAACLCKNNGEWPQGEEMLLQLRTSCKNQKSSLSFSSSSGQQQETSENILIVNTNKKLKTGVQLRCRALAWHGQGPGFDTW